VKVSDGENKTGTGTTDHTVVVTTGIGMTTSGSNPFLERQSAGQDEGRGGDGEEDHW
jgi:hypothetical protein